MISFYIIIKIILIYIYIIYIYIYKLIKGNNNFADV